ncbi:CrcB family protein [Arthrobacter gandavensis]|uniref:fluoride efflux transporter FluC n=1 Tax=Arthrobacter gandavensis TaxID=169960 RepID=UPI0018906AB8|nr:CrcB family protein [Arthrobacter gandavensis]MBF4994890.1 CrcB family protein [Arthrobacter gandavensis]
MTPWLFLLLSLSGGAGAALRFVIDGLIRSRLKTAFQWATTLINVSGSAILGVLTGLTVDRMLPSELGIAVGTALLGGYTTFSTASYETVQLLREGRRAAAFLSGVLMLAASVGAAFAGLWVGTAL